MNSRACEISSVSVSASRRRWAAPAFKQCLISGGFCLPVTVTRQREKEGAFGNAQSGVARAVCQSLDGGTSAQLDHLARAIQPERKRIEIAGKIHPSIQPQNALTRIKNPVGRIARAAAASLLIAVPSDSKPSIVNRILPELRQPPTS